MRVKRRAVTLIEILIVIAILAIAAGVVGISIQRSVREQHFHGEVQQVVDHLRIAQDLMLIAGAEVKVTFRQQNDGIDMELVCDDKLPEKWDRLIRRKSKLTHIHGVHFDTDIDDGLLTLSFLSHGSVMSRGVLRLVAQETRYIALEGYPRPIKAVSERPILKETNLSEIVQLTIQELNEKKTFANPA